MSVDIYSKCTRVWLATVPARQRILGPKVF